MIGDLYTIQLSVREIYGIDKDEETSSRASLLTTSSGSQRRLEKPRPCFIWKVNGTRVTVLLCTRFSGKNPRDSSVFPEIEKSYLLETIVLIKPDGQGAVPECFNSPNLPNLSNGTFLILIEYQLSVWERELKKGKSRSLNQAQLLYIANQLTSLALKQVIKVGQAHGELLLEMDREPPLIHSDSNESNRSNESSTARSMEAGRNQNELMDKQSFIERWINEGKIKFKIRKQTLINISFSDDYRRI